MKFSRWLSELALLVAIKANEWVLQPIAWLLETLIGPVLRIAMIGSILLSSAYLVLKAQTIHQNYIRATVGPSVYFALTKEDGGGGGTGFAVVAPSGKTYVVTNDHICVNAEKDTLVLMTNDNVRKTWAKIVERSQTTDLCLLEAPYDAVGLHLAQGTYAGDRVQAVGHPDLMRLSLSNIGEIIQAGPTALFDGAELNDEEEGAEHPQPAPLAIIAKCDPKNKKFKLIEGPLGLGPIGCRIEIPEAYFTNVLIQPGNSGSPLVNFSGDVVGVISGVDKYGWGIAVSLNDLRQFLSNK